MSDNKLWCDEEGKDGQVVAFSNLLELSDQQVALSMAQQERFIMDMTGNLATHLMNLEEIVVAAHKVADIIPNLNNNKQKEFWHDQIIPILTDSLRQDIKSRVIINECFSAIRDVTTVIQNNYNIVKRNNSSETAIKTAQKCLTEAFENLNDAIVKAKSLNTNALEKFDEYAPKIYKNIGPEAAKNVEKKSKYEEDINKRIYKQKQYLSHLNNLNDVINRYIYIIQAIDKQLSKADAHLENGKQKLAQLNGQSENSNRNIYDNLVNFPPIVKKHIQTCNIHESLIFNKKMHTTKTVPVDDRQREAETRYYGNVAKAETQRIKDNCMDEEIKQKILKEYWEKLMRDRLKYQSQLDIAKNIFDNLCVKFNLLLINEQEQIEELTAKIIELNNREQEVIDKIGLMGRPLIQCLTNIRTFAKSVQKGASAFAPLVSILNAVNVMLKDDIRLLKSKEKADIFLAGQLMMHKVQFLSKYNLDAYETIQPSIEYKHLEMDKDSRLAIEDTPRKQK